MSAHAPLPPSFAPVWGECSAAVMAAMTAPNIDTEESREGTSAHWVFAKVMRNILDHKGPTECHKYIGQVAENGVVIDDKMAEGAQVIVDDMLQVIAKHRKNEGESIEVFIEQRVDMAPIHPQNWGTLDGAVVISTAAKGVIAIYLWDYKHGHRSVSAEGNLQLIDYMQGLRYKFGIGGVQDQEVIIVLRIVHPFSYSNSGPIDTWAGKLSDLCGYVNKLHDKAHEAFTNPLMTTGLHCRDCPGKGPCSARRKADYNFIDYSNQPYEMDTMNGHDLTVERDILKDGIKVAGARLKDIEDNLHHRITEGESDTGLTLEATSGDLAWTVEPAIAAAMTDQFGVDIRVEKVKTPTQAKTAVPGKYRAIYAQAIEAVTKRPPGKLKLTKASDSRTARAFMRK